MKRPQYVYFIIYETPKVSMSFYSKRAEAMQDAKLYGGKLVKHKIKVK